MKKAILIALLCFTGSKLFAQTDEIITEEKTSDWVRISVPPTPARNAPKRRSASKPAATASAQQPAAPPKTSDAFDKTNKQVKRFRKKD